MKKELILYHGSTSRIETPIYGYGKSNNDYGLGFYCTETENLAKEWACTSEENGFSNKYILDVKDLKVLDLNNGQYHILNWLAILLDNRNFNVSNPVARNAKKYILENYLPDYKAYDVIRGYRADDSYFTFADNFLNNVIPLSNLEEAMMLGNLGEQVVLKSKKAFSKIKYVGDEVAEKAYYYPKKMNRDLDAREKYKKIREEVNIENDTFMVDILRQKWRDDDERLQRIVCR